MCDAEKGVEINTGRFRYIETVQDSTSLVRPEFIFGSSDGPPVDFHAALLHELGHFLGLDHLPDEFLPSTNLHPVMLATYFQDFCVSITETSMLNSAADANWTYRGKPCSGLEGPAMISSRFINIISAIYIVGAVIIAIASYWLVVPTTLTELPGANLDKPANAGLTLSSDLIKLQLTLATGLVSVCVWLLTRPLTDSLELVERAIWTALALFALCLSLYFGFVALHRILIMVSFNGFDPRLDLVWWPQSLQYYAFVAGAALLGLGCIRSLNAIVERRS